MSIGASRPTASTIGAASDARRGGLSCNYGRHGRARSTVSRRTRLPHDRLSQAISRGQDG
jgi:hypothetical protein